MERRGEAAFSLVELAAVLAIIGILAAFAIPRFAGTTAFAARGAYDQAQGLVASARRIAIAQRQSTPKPPVYVLISAGQIRACYDPACGAILADPASGTPLVLDAAPGVTFGPATTFSFDGAGTPSFATQLAVTVASSGPGDPTRTFFVEARTGYVHE